MNVNLTNIFGTDYKVSFSEKGYQALNDQLTNNYSAIFLLVDKNTKKYCLPHFLHKIKVLRDNPVISIEAGEVNKHL